MARRGTKTRPAIIRVQTEARAREIASVFTEHGWKFIIGVEPDKPENIADLTRLLQTKRSGHQRASEKTKKSIPRRNSHAPLRVMQTRKEPKKLSPTNIQITDQQYVYFLKTGSPTLYTIISGALSVFFLIKLLTTLSLWYIAILVVPLLCFLCLLNAFVLNQRVIFHGNTVTILRRMHRPLTATVGDALYQIIVKNSTMAHFRFRSEGQAAAQITPSAYKNGEQLRQQLTAIISQENIVVDMVEK